MDERSRLDKLLPAVRTDDLVSQVTERLADAIITGRLSPGDRVVEAALARELKVSRSPIREAARRLEQQGLLVSHPRRGFFVRELSVREVDELYGLRLCLETYAAGVAATRMGEKEVALLTSQLEELNCKAAEGDLPGLVDADLRFHQLIFDIAGNRRLRRLFDELTTEIRMIIGVVGLIYEDPHRLADIHQPLLDALSAGDAEQVRREVEYHINVAWQVVRSYFSGKRPAT